MKIELMSHKTKRAFTLIELLVVIAIISILAAILFPVFARARESARRASCMSNMKQLALGWMMYTQDYDGELPYYDYSGSEMGKLMPYVKSKQVFICPSANLPNTHLYDPAASSYGTDYGMPAIYPTAGNAALYNINYGGSVAIMDTIPQPSITCLMAETARISGSLANLVGFDRFRANPAPPLDITTDQGFSGVADVSRHFDGSNYAFMDGHVKWLASTVALKPHAQNQAIVFYWP